MKKLYILIISFCINLTTFGEEQKDDAKIFEVTQKSKEKYIIKNVSSRHLVIMKEYKLVDGNKSAIHWVVEMKNGRKKYGRETYSFPATPFPMKVGEFSYVPLGCEIEVDISVEGKGTTKFAIPYFDPALKFADLRKIIKYSNVVVKN